MLTQLLLQAIRILHDRSQDDSVTNVMDGETAFQLYIIGLFI